ncbi:MAG: ATP-dependent helicase [Pseudomonadales bacterium]|nr:ATP-dependent helicase [Pseudomonadales bacterium]
MKISSKKTDAQKAFLAAYEKLNVNQKEAVDSIEGPVMVIAGPGTGKTQILTLRIANVLRTTDTAPESILALTFTNAGVRNMRERLHSYIGDEAYRVGIYTFHSFAEHILQHYRSYFPAHEYATVITDVEKAKLLETILTEHEFTELISAYDRFSSLAQVMDAIGNIKQEGLTPAEFEARIPAWEAEQMEAETMFYKRATGKYGAGDIKPTELQKVKKRVAKAREVATVFAAYQAALQKQNRYDFSDMIITVLTELKRNENLKLDLQEQYQYVLVDEHQDTNDGQNQLIELLTDAEHLNGHPNLFTVGDEKQAIYRFQGASDKAFRHFTEHYTDVKVISLVENYRSSAPILSAAHELIVHSLPEATTLHSNSEETKPVSVREFSDYKFELLFVVTDIQAKLAAGIPPNEIAIIYRSNKHLTEIKTLFQEYQIPYHVLSRDTLLDDPMIQMFVHLLRVVADPYDDHSLGTLLFADFLGLDPLGVVDTLREYRKTRRDLAATGNLIGFLKEQARYHDLTTLIANLKRHTANHQFVETFKEALHLSGYLSHVLARTDSQTALRKIEVLFNESRKQADRDPGYQLADFIAFVDAAVSYGLPIEFTAARVGSGVQCMTAHGSKGLEFEQVYLLNTTRSNWEKSRGFSAISLPLERYVGELDDERRLFYVALTRAKSHVSISSSRQDWTGKALEPSQFIEELAADAIEHLPTETFEVEHERKLVQFFSTTTPSESIFDPVYLAERFTEENLSVTALNNYLDCPLRYLFRNLIQLPDTYTSALRYGDTMHRALEDFFKQSKEQGKVLSKTALLDAYKKAMDTSGFTEQDWQMFLTKGRRSLGMYHDYYHSSWTTDVLLEQYVRRTLSLPQHELTLSGKIDKLEFLETFGSGPVRVVDYKTGKVFSKKSTKAQKQALERQIHFYHLLLEGYKSGDITVKEAVLDFVEPSDENEFEQKSLATSEADRTALIQEIESMASDVLSGEFLEKGCNKKDCEACRLWSALHEGSGQRT